MVVFQAHFAQSRTSGTMSPLMPGYHNGAPRLAPPQVYFGQVGPGLIPQAPTYGYQQQHLPGLQQGVPSNFVMPFQLQQQTQPGQRLSPRRGGNSPQPQQQVCDALIVDQSLYILIRVLTNTCARFRCTPIKVSADTCRMHEMESIHPWFLKV